MSQKPRRRRLRRRRPGAIYGPYEGDKYFRLYTYDEDGRTVTRSHPTEEAALEAKQRYLESQDWPGMRRKLRYTNFYALAVVPELNPGRVKFGSAYDIATRVTNHRTTCPTATLLRAGRIETKRERETMKWLAEKAGGKHVGGEVYDFADVVRLLRVMDECEWLEQSP